MDDRTIIYRMPLPVGRGAVETNELPSAALDRAAADLMKRAHEMLGEAATLRSDADKLRVIGQ